MACGDRHRGSLSVERERLKLKRASRSKWLAAERGLE
jgi:hypothetical protein